MKQNKSIYAILISTCVFVMIFSLIMIVMCALNLSNADNLSQTIIQIIMFLVLFLLGGVGMGIIIAIKKSTTNTTKYDNQKKE